MRILRLGPATLAATALACAPVATAGPGCAESAPVVRLGPELGETSGVAVSRRDAAVLWTHNDGNSELYALDRDGSVLARFALSGPMRDWEDLEVASCATAGSCLFLADTGDNAERRPPGDVRLLRVAEPATPALGDGATVPLDADVFPVRLPEGPRDIEALFVLPDEVPYLVTKGENHAITVYRYPPPLRPDTVTLEVVQRLSGAAVQLLNRVTGASASRDGSWVAVRTYQALHFYRPEADTLRAVTGGVVNLRTLQEIQGEGVGLGPDGDVVLTSEGGPLGGPASLRMLRCDLDRG